MKHHISIIFIYILLLLCAAMLLPTTSYAQSCELGIKTCDPLIGVSKKYHQCMRLICKRAATQTTKNATQIMQCKKGFLRCNTLRENPLHYWTCVDDTCRNPPLFEKYANCSEGHKSCKPKIANYWHCMSQTCGTIYSDFKTCLAGRDQCKPALGIYWDCVHEQCLGLTDKYRDPAYYNETVKSAPVYQYLTKNQTRELPPAYMAPPLTSVPREFRFAPARFNPFDWTVSTPSPTRLITGSASSNYRCTNPRANLSCLSRDVSSCICSDDTLPKKR